MKYVGLDLGSVTCGVAKSDTGFLAQAVKTIRFESENYDDALEKVKEYLSEYKPNVVVLGYPLLENGDVGPRAQLSEEFRQALIEDTGLEVVLQDERCTTKDSEEFLIQANVSRKKRKKIIDQQAAIRILQYYLDSIKSKRENMEVKEKDLEKINGGYTKDEIISKINTVFLFVPEDIRNEIIYAIETSGFKAARKLCEKLLANKPYAKSMIDLIPSENIFD